MRRVEADIDADTDTDIDAGDLFDLFDLIDPDLPDDIDADGGDVFNFDLPDFPIDRDVFDRPRRHPRPRGG